MRIGFSRITSGPRPHGADAHVAEVTRARYPGRHTGNASPGAQGRCHTGEAGPGPHGQVRRKVATRVVDGGHRPTDFSGTGSTLDPRQETVNHELDGHVSILPGPHRFAPIEPVQHPARPPLRACVRSFTLRSSV